MPADLPPGATLNDVDQAFPDGPDPAARANPPPDLAIDLDEDRDGEHPTVRIDDLLIDETTGEILAAPAGLSPDRLDWLIAQGLDAQREEKSWTAAKGAYGSAVRRLLADAGLTTYRCDYGGASVRSRRTRRSSAERVAAVVSACDLQPEQLAAIWRCAKELDPDKIQALVYQDVIAQRVAEGLITHGRSRPWTQFTPPRRAAPRIARTAARRA